MGSVLQELYGGELRPFERMQSSEEHIDCRKKCIQSSESLCQILRSISPELETKFKLALDDYSALCAVETEDMFCYGFSLGIKLLIEAYLLTEEGSCAAPPRSH